MRIVALITQVDNHQSLTHSQMTIMGMQLRQLAFLHIFRVVFMCYISSDQWLEFTKMAQVQL